MLHKRCATAALVSVLLGGAAAPGSQPHGSEPRGVEEPGVEARSREERSTETKGPGVPLFIDVTAESGLSFVHFNGMSGELYPPENTGAGAALFDYDNDGDLDLYLVQGRMLGSGKRPEQAVFPPPPGELLRDRLYRNDLEILSDGTRKIAFRDVTEESRIRAAGYGMGVATGDIDNDGWIDLYVTNFGSNQLLRNRGDGTFEDLTRSAGVDDERWSVPAVFFDFDRDGWLDLYVGNYVDWSFEVHRTCVSESGERDYCSPLTYRQEPDRLFHNRGASGAPRFVDVTERAGLGEPGAALGAAAADLNSDGRPDLYVANDLSANQLWIQGKEGRFTNEALLAGCAVNRNAEPEASMGVDIADFDGDGDGDLFMTHLTRETNTLFVNDGRGLFRDRSLESGLANPSWASTGFGTAFFDYDNDSLLDLAVVNGAVYVIPGLAREQDPYPLHQPNQLFRNLGGGKFADMTKVAGPGLERSEVSRGAAFGDLDNDGDTDFVISNNSGPARVLLNQTDDSASWLGLRLVDAEGLRDQLGARVAVTRVDGSVLWRRVRTDGSYASARDPRVLVGLAGDKAIRKVVVHWPSGRQETFFDLPLGAYHTLREGTSPSEPEEP